MVSRLDRAQWLLIYLQGRWSAKFNGSKILLLAGTSGFSTTVLYASFRKKNSWNKKKNSWRPFLWLIPIFGIILLSNSDSFVGTHIIPSQRYIKKTWISFSKDGIHLAKWNNILVGGFNPFEKYARQIGNLPQIGMKIKNIWNHHLVFHQPRCPWNPLKGSLEPTQGGARLEQLLEGQKLSRLAWWDDQIRGTWPSEGTEKLYKNQSNLYVEYMEYQIYYTVCCCSFIISFNCSMSIWCLYVPLFSSLLLLLLQFYGRIQITDEFQPSNIARRVQGEIVGTDNKASPVWCFGKYTPENQHKRKIIWTKPSFFGFHVNFRGRRFWCKVSPSHFLSLLVAWILLTPTKHLYSKPRDTMDSLV